MHAFCLCRRKMFRRGLIIFCLMVYKLHVTNASDCDCSCRGRRNRPICDTMEELWKISDSNTRKLMEWERYRPFVERFSERWKIEIADIVEMKINEYMSNKNYLPKPENLVSELNDIIEVSNFAYPYLCVCQCLPMYIWH